MDKLIGIDFQILRLKDLLETPGNPQVMSDEELKGMVDSMRKKGWLLDAPAVWARPDGKHQIISGHHRVQAGIMAGILETGCKVIKGISEEQAKILVLEANQRRGRFDDSMLNDFIDDIIEFSAFDKNDLFDEIGISVDEKINEIEKIEKKSKANDTLAEKFLVPPFSVLNARSGWWQDRKRAWIDLGIKSHLGRGGGLLKFSETATISTYSDKSLGTIPPNEKDILNRSGSYKNKAAAFRDKDGLNKIKNLTWTGAAAEFDHYRVKNGEKKGSDQSGTSIFDPVLCEIIYKWFTAENSLIIDPFAGGSVRGIVASKLQRKYIGVELRAEQIEANILQVKDICSEAAPQAVINTDDDLTPEITPVEKIDNIYFKRDDKFSIGGGKGGKVRTCWHLAQGAKGLVTAGSRSSPQVNIVAQIAKKLGIPCRAHTPQGALSPEVKMAQQAGAEIIQHKAGYNNVIIKRASDDAEALGWTNIPFGMECEEAVEMTARQVENIPADIKRIVVPVGSGMSLSGILHGLKNFGLNIPVLGIVVGADPVKRLNKFAPEGWEEMVELVRAAESYDEYAAQTEIKGIKLDPIYEAKCISFLQDGDLLWIVGIRASENKKSNKSDIIPEWIEGDSRQIDDLCFDIYSDFIFSCPPYVDLEVYSDDPRDISTFAYEEFLKAYREIIIKSCKLLKDDRFACFVVGEVRDKKGNYYNFVGDTIKAFEDAGLNYYNEIILVAAIGSLPIRVGRQFNGGRKIGKTHQNILVFVKGDAKKATEYCGKIEIPDLSHISSEGDDSGFDPEL
jgi:1-aminocyclopropane-1-carboxylate deaminase/D-cysteine desulfhydrase-like pyridoxal-dependent ACC family enzyme/DNA modification methylase